MSETTMRLGLPFIEAGQAAKELTHNEALARLDLAVQASVLTVGDNQPPAAPAIGAAWIVGTAPLGGWSGEAGSLAGWSASGWRFVRPVEGMAVWVASAGMKAVHRGGEWRVGELAGATLTVGGVRVVGTQAAAVAEPRDGGTIDAESRSAIIAILAALRHHGLIAT